MVISKADRMDESLAVVLSDRTALQDLEVGMICIRIFVQAVDHVTKSKKHVSSSAAFKSASPDHVGSFSSFCVLW